MTDDPEVHAFLLKHLLAIQENDLDELSRHDRRRPDALRMVGHAAAYRWAAVSRLS